MKKLFFSFAAFIGLTLFSPSVLANCYCPQGMVHGNQCVAPAGPNQSMVAVGMAICDSGGYYRPEPSFPPPPQIIYDYDYLVMMWTKSGNIDDSYFFRRRHKTPYEGDFNTARVDQEALDACNADPRYSPCKYATSVMGDGCIAYMDSPKVMYSQNGNTCEAAREVLIKRCMAHYKNRNSCSAKVHYKRPVDIALGIHR